MPYRLPYRSTWRPACISRVLLLFTVTVCAVSTAHGLDEPGLQLTGVRRPVGQVGTSPRPAIHAEHVPLRTSFFMLISPPDRSDQVLPDSVTVELQAEEGEAFDVLRRGQQFAPGYSGKLSGDVPARFQPAIMVFVDSATELRPDTQYTIRVRARSEKGRTLSEAEGVWSFTTESAPAVRRVAYALDFQTAAPVHWEGEFFSGLAKPSFGTTVREQNPHYDLMVEARKQYPHAWTLFRDAYLAGFEHRPTLLKAYPNIVRERETRRITSITRRDDGVLLAVEDFFGHQQYGIESGRPLSGDYRPGDEILIADGLQSARAEVIGADDRARTVLVTDFEEPGEAWQIEYAGPLPTRENPTAPGLFPPGGTYLRKFNPTGTAHYYWGRLHYVWDRLHGEYGFRLIPRFAGAPGDLALDGRGGTTAKCLVQLHEVTRAITSHIIERYGDAVLDWPWVILNEPDLMSIYWRTRDWKELQRFYDYSSDAILRAFEDHGYDSQRVRIGGLELGAIAGLNLRVHDFLIHASPRATGNGALELNAAYGDVRLDGRRSRRVEALCGANGGRGAPLDFLSIHTYNDAEMAAQKLIRAKEIALEIDLEYFETLWIVNHESVPAWRPITDPGAAEMYLGNGYFPTWATHLKARLLQRAAEDSRHAYGGQSPLMSWPGVRPNFSDLNDVVREIRLPDRTEVVPSPIFNYLSLLSTMQGDFRVLPPLRFGGHYVAGFSSTTDEDVRIVLYSHHPHDTQSRSDMTFEVSLALAGLGWDHVEVEQYQFDRANNTYYEVAREFRRREGRQPRNAVYTEAELQQVADLATMRATGRSVHSPNDAGTLRTVAPVAGNGVNFLVIRPSNGGS